MEIINLMGLFAPLFSKSVWESAVVLVIGAILALGKRTVSAILRTMGLSQAKNYQTYHRVLNRAVWSSRKASHILLGYLIAAFVPIGPLIMGLDDTIERRWGKRIAARGIYKDPVRSSDEHFVKASGLRWLSLMLLMPIPWALIKDPKAKFEPQALLCTDLSAMPVQILQWFRLRWQVEVTFGEVRAHLGVETQRQWSPLAIGRTTPTLLALFSIVVTLAHQWQTDRSFMLPKAAWYQKSLPTFSDALALVRQRLWQMQTFQMSASQPDTVKVPRDLFNIWSDLLCYAA